VLLSSGDFHENFCSESHTSRVLITFCMHFLHFYLLLKMVHDCELYENWCSENRSLLNDVIHFPLYFPHLLCVVDELWYKVSEHNAVNVCEFHENWHRKDCTFLMGVTEITFIHVL
jgi:hypothetical protein